MKEALVILNTKNGYICSSFDHRYKITDSNKIMCFESIDSLKQYIENYFKNEKE